MVFHVLFHVVPNVPSLSHHFLIIFQSFSNHFPIIFQSFSHHFPTVFHHFPIIVPSFSHHFPIILHFPSLFHHYSTIVPSLSSFFMARRHPGSRLRTSSAARMAMYFEAPNEVKPPRCWGSQDSVKKPPVG